MDKGKKDVWKFPLKSDMINVIVGIVLIVSLIFVYRNPYNTFAILTACVAGGLINILNGLNTMKDPKRKTTGATFLMMGIFLIVLGFIITQYVMK
jgi:uncharacterized membrane protein HdeD (DUF308 family)